MYETWEQLKADCMGCRKCDLCETRTNLVFGVGNENAEVLLSARVPARMRICKVSRSSAGEASCSTNTSTQSTSTAKEYLYC